MPVPCSSWGRGESPSRNSLGEEPASGMLLGGEWMWGEVRKWPGFPLAHMQVTGVPGKDDLPPLYRGAPQGPPSPARRVSAPNFLPERDLFRATWGGKGRGGRRMEGGRAASRARERALLPQPASLRRHPLPRGESCPDSAAPPGPTHPAPPPGLRRPGARGRAPRVTFRKRSGHRRLRRPAASPGRSRRRRRRGRLFRCAETLCWQGPCAAAAAARAPRAAPRRACCARAPLPGDRHCQAEPRPLRARRAAALGTRGRPDWLPGRWLRPLPHGRAPPRVRGARGCRLSPRGAAEGAVPSWARLPAGAARERLRSWALQFLLGPPRNRHPQREEKEKTFSLGPVAGKAAAAAVLV